MTTKKSNALETVLFPESDDEDLLNDGFDDSPGPISYKLPDTVGRQPLSTFKSPAALSFGYSRREGLSTGNDYPGPGAYYRETRLGDSKISTIRRATDFTLGGSEKATGTKSSMGTPGPGQYGRDYYDPKFKSSPQCTLTSRKASNSSRHKQQVPPPGAYKTFEVTSCKVPISTIKNASMVSFGLGERAVSTGDAQISAAPGDYQIRHSIGVQCESHRKSSPSCEIKGKREYKQKPSSTRTGPGYYKTETGIGVQRTSGKKTGPSFSMSGRTSFGGYMRG